MKRAAAIFPPRFAKLLKKFSLKVQAFKRVFDLTLSKEGVEGVGQVSCNKQLRNRNNLVLSISSKDA